jgi:hypothetical protein
MKCIDNLTLDEMVQIIDGLVKRGLTFRAMPNGKGDWKIELTGGH